MTNPLQEYSEALSCGVSAWSEFWGDPWLTGSFMVATYLLAAALLFREARALQGFERFAWMLSAVLFVFHAANTPLDLHGLAWATGRCLAHIQGWYDHKEAVQREVFLVVGLMSAALVVATVMVLRRDFRHNSLLILGVGLSVGIMVIKGVTYRPLEPIYLASLGPLSIADIVELIGIALAVLAAFSKARARRIVQPHVRSRRA